jgi:tRNA A-37 threonylcarbamoyl transferase component Bud32
VTEQPALPQRYRLIRKLGAGGMGRVWLAEDTVLKRQVALKQLIRSGDETAELARRRQRVFQEAQALANVKHPGIVPIHDLFVVNGDPWIVMEHIEGKSLDTIIGAGTLRDERSIARIGLRVLDGLAAAHRAGIVHRDVKPANILVTANGAAFLVDFGIARRANDPSLSGLAIVGTVEYLAPERLKQGATIGPSADIWALGVTLFYALEGYSPFRRGDQDTHATLLAIMDDMPQPARRGPLTDITLRMLVKDPADRATTAEVRRALKRVVNGERKPSAPPAAIARAAPVPAPPVPSPAVPAPPVPVGPGPTVGLRAEILRANPDEGAKVLMSLDVLAAARLLADCPAKRQGELLQGIAAVEPAAAATILPMLLASVAGSAFGYLRPKIAASLLAAMPPLEAGRILGSADPRAAASAVMELAPRLASAALRSMPDRQRAAEVLSHAQSAAVVAVARADRGFARLVLPYLAETQRAQVSRALAAGA